MFIDFYRFYATDWKKTKDPEFSPISGSSYYTSHGTHVSGTIAGTGENKESEFATIGVAPDAQLYGYRVLGPYGSGYTSDIVAAIEKSVDDGMDVINLSLGANINDPLFPTAVAANNAMISGVVTVLANGNAGPNPGSVGTPGTAPLPISVGASSTSIQIPKYEVSTGNINTVGRLLGRDFSIDLTSLTGGELVYCGYGYSWELNNKGLNGKIALIERGKINLNDKIANAKKAGAKAVIVYNNEAGEIEHYLGESKSFVQTIAIDQESGIKLKEALKVQNSLTIKINQKGYTGTKEDLLASFSSRGPVNNGDIKPDVVAPGVSIMSTYPEFINHPEDGQNYTEAYARISGTSMAAPHVAGVSALMLQKNSNDKEYDSFDVKVALMNTADDLSEKYGVNEIGAGRIDALEAVDPDTTIEYTDKSESINENGELIEIYHKTGAISFGVVQKSNKIIDIKKQFVVSNKTNKNANFDVKVEYVEPTQTNGAKDAIKNNVKIEIRDSILSNKNKDTKVNFNLIIPNGAEEGIYQGYIKLINKKDKSKIHNIPFSVNYVESGIAPIKISTHSVTNEIEWLHPWLSSGMMADIKTNTPIQKIDIYVREYETNKLIGYRGTLDATLMVPGVTYTLSETLNMLLSVYPVDENNNISPIYRALEEGKYKIEFVSTDKDGNKVSKNQPFIVDNTPAKISELNHQGGVYEISEDMFTTQTDNNGVEHNAFWINGKVEDEGISKLKEIGINKKLSDMTMQLTLNGRPYTKTKINDDGKYKFGITMEDVESGGASIRTLPVDIATALNHDSVPIYFFMKKGEPYLYTKADKKEVNEGEQVTITTDLNNISDSSTFSIPLEYVRGYKPVDVRLNQKAKEILDEKGYTAEISYKEESESVINKLDIDVQIKDSEGNKVNINGDIPLVDATFILEDDINMHMYSSYFLSFSPEITDKDGNSVNLYSETVHDIISNKQNSSTIILGESAEGILDSYRYDLEEFEQYLFVEDSNGKKYPVKYNSDEGTYYAKDLPVTENEYKVTSNVPGHFKNYIISKVYRNIDGKLYGKSSVLYNESIALAGDTNGDGVIDINDAKEVASVYNKTKDINGKDFNFDGVVDKNDMDYVVKNYLSVNKLEENPGKPEEDSDKAKLEQILKEIGY